MLRRTTGKTTADLLAKQAHSSSLLGSGKGKLLIYSCCYLLACILLRSGPILFYRAAKAVVAYYVALPDPLRLKLNVVVDLIPPVLVGTLLMAAVYFWGVCMPKAVSILFNSTRFKRFGIIGAIHIVTCGVAMMMGIGNFYYVAVFRQVFDPASPPFYILTMGFLGCISMISSFFLFHLLPKLEKKLFRRFFIGALTSLLASFVQVVVWTHYKVNVAGDGHEHASVIVQALLKYWAPLTFAASSVLLVANIIHCGDEVLEMTQRLCAAYARRDLGARRRSLMRNGNVVPNLARSYFRSDAISKFVTRRSISYSNLQAHSMLEVGWAQIWLAGTELGFASIFFYATFLGATQGHDAGIENFLHIFAATDETNPQTRHLAYVQTLTNLGNAYVFYGGVVFPLSLVLKGKLSAQAGRSLITLYSLAFAAMTVYVTNAGLSFYYPIAAAYSVFLAKGLATVAGYGSSAKKDSNETNLSMLCPVMSKKGTLPANSISMCPVMSK